MNISALFTRMIVLFATMGIGYTITKLGLMDTAFNQKLTKIVLNVTMPMMFLSSVINVEHVLTNHDVLVLTLVAAGCYAFLILVSLLLPTLLHVSSRDGGTYRFMYIFSNIGFMGYPVVQSIFGSDANFYVTIFVLFFNLLVFTIGVTLIRGGQEKLRFSWAMFRKPAIVAALASYLLYLLNLHLPPVVADIVSYTGDLTSPLSMLILGCSLAFIPLGPMFRNAKLYLTLALKMIATPLLVYFMLHRFVHNELLLGVVVTMLSMPVATNSTMFALEYGGDEQLASSGVFVSTILSIFSIPAIIWLLFSH